MDAGNDPLDRRVLLGGAAVGTVFAATAARAATSPSSTLVVSSRDDVTKGTPTLAGVAEILVLRYDHNCPIAPAAFVRVAAEPKHPGKLKAADGSWWELTDTAVPLPVFGARGNAQDDANAIDDAFAFLTAKGGGELIVPAGHYGYARDIRLMGNHISIRGFGPASILMGLKNARFILGEAILVDGRKTGTKILETRISNLSIAPAGNHAGECVLVDYADNTTFTDLNVGPFTQDGRSVTHGVKTNWAQYTQWRNVSIIVNGYGIYIYLPKTNRENEDHFSIYSSWLYCGKYRNPGCRPASIAVERQTGRNAPIFQFAVYSTHLGAFMADQGNGRGFTSGIFCINPDAGKRVFHGAHLVSCMFEYVTYGIDMKSSAPSDNSRYLLESCSFLHQEVCYLGVPGHGTLTSIGNYYLQCPMIVDGPRIVFDGHNIQETTGKLSAQPLSYHRFVHKDPAGISLSGVCLARAGNQQVEAGNGVLKIACNLNLSPDKFRLVPSWNTTFWVSDISETAFTVHFGSPPAKQENLYWDVEAVES